MVRMAVMVEVILQMYVDKDFLNLNIEVTTYGYIE
jgi:hypothetical protein